MKTASNILGAVFALLGALLIAAGTNLLKFSHLKAGNSVKYYLRFDWWVGFAVAMSGYVCAPVAASFGDPVLVVAVRGAFLALSQVSFAVYWLKEPLLKVDIIAVVLLVAACIIFAVEAQPSKDYNLSDIRKYQSDHNLIISISIVLLVTTGLQLIVGIVRKHVLTDPSNERWAHFHCFIYASTCQIDGAFSQLFCTVFGKLIASSFSEVLKTVDLWAYIFAMVFFLGLNIHFLQYALELGDAIPVLSWGIAFTMSSGDFITQLYFQTYDYLWLGHALLAMAVLLLWFHPKSKTTNKDRMSLVNDLWEERKRSEILTGYR